MNETNDSREAVEREQAVTEREAANERRTAELAEQALALAKHEAHLSEVERRQEETAKDLKDLEGALEEQAAEQGAATRAASGATPPLVPGTNLVGSRRSFEPDVVMKRRAEQIKAHTEKVNEDRGRGAEAQKAAVDPKRTGRHLPNTSPYA